MPTTPETLAKSRKDAGILCEFVSLWCHDHHGGSCRSPWDPSGPLGAVLPAERPILCEECRRVLGYALGRRLLCGYDPKPDCKKCPTPCYRDEHRLRMREIMRYSGWRLILRGRIDVLLRYFL